MKYPNHKFVVETQYGVYPIGEWHYCTTRENLQDAIEFCEHWGTYQYRVVNSKGDVVYPIDPLVNDPTTKTDQYSDC